MFHFTYLHLRHKKSSMSIQLHYFIDWRDSTIPLYCHPYSYPILVLSLFNPLLSINIWFHRTSNRTNHKNWLIFSFMNIFKNWLYSSIESRFFSLVFCSSLSFIFLFLCQKGIYEHACGLSLLLSFVVAQNTTGMLFHIVFLIIFCSLAIGLYEPVEDFCIRFSCDEGESMVDGCIPIPSSYLPTYFQSM